METAGKLSRSLNLGLTDAAALLLVYLIPTLSHVTPFPLYMADPMRLVVLGTLLVTRNWKNTLALAVTLPVFSFLVSAHPVFPKCLLISAELSVNVLLFAWLSRNFTKAVGISAMASIIVSKLCYYGFKALLIGAGLLSMNLISTDVLFQIIVAAALSSVFAVVYSKSEKTH